MHGSNATRGPHAGALCVAFTHVGTFSDAAKRLLGIDGSEGRKSVELILAIYKSAVSGKPVKLPLATDPYSAIVKGSNAIPSNR